MPPQLKLFNNNFVLLLSKQKKKPPKDSLLPLTINPKLFIPAYTRLSNHSFCSWLELVQVRSEIWREEQKSFCRRK